MPAISPRRPGDPDRLGDYRVLARLGRGGMATVYPGEAPDGRRVAIKVIRADLLGDDKLRGRFRSEVNRLRQVPPFRTAAIVDAGLDDDPPYPVVEYVDGPSLADVLRERGPLSTGDVHTLAVGTATGLTAIHGAGVIHRDLKPDNVLFARGGVKVIESRGGDLDRRHPGHGRGGHLPVHRGRQPAGRPTAERHRGGRARRGPALGASIAPEIVSAGTVHFPALGR